MFDSYVLARYTLLSDDEVDYDFNHVNVPETDEIPCGYVTLKQKNTEKICVYLVRFLAWSFVVFALNCIIPFCRSIVIHSMIVCNFTHPIIWMVSLIILTNNG